MSFGLSQAVIKMNSFRWLIDTDQDEAGMKVICDLHGGDPHDPTARTEFHEIKEVVLRDVGY
jgi:hypothetical protein